MEQIPESVVSELMKDVNSYILSNYRHTVQRSRVVRRFNRWEFIQK